MSPRAKNLLRIKAEVDAAARQLHRERCRAWRLAHPERSKAASRKWAARNPGAKKLSNRLWKFFNREKDRALTAAWRVKNPNYDRERAARLRAEGAYSPGGKYWRSRAKVRPEANAC